MAPRLPPLSLLATTTLAMGQTASLTTSIQRAADPVVIDPVGAYIRASHYNHNSTSGILVGYAASPGDGTQILRTALSTDSARSWSPLGEVWRADAATRDIDNAMPLQLPSGRILYAFRNHDRDAASGAYTYYRITACASDDGGNTWHFLSHVAERAATSDNNGLWEPFLRNAADGTVQVYYSSENSARDQDNLMRYSRDGGATWSGDVIVSGADTDTSRDGMTGVTGDGNGALVCVFESTESGRFSIERVRSHDDGYTWGERARLYTAGNGKGAGAPQVMNVGGTLVASFMTNEAVGTAQIDGAQMKVVMSVDWGAAWSSSGGGDNVKAVLTADKGSHWPGLWALDDRNFLALYSKDGQGALSQICKLV